MRGMEHHAHHDHGLGLQADLRTLLQQTANRRRALRWLAGGLNGFAATLEVGISV
jgi:hypothetical protein